MIRRALAQACWNLLVPVARFVLRRGMTFLEFEEISKSAFVYVGSREFGLQGRPANVSRVSTLTGLARRDVRKRLDAPDVDLAMGVHDMHPAASILTRWHQDTDFLDSFGKPKALDTKEQPSEFAQLVAVTNASLVAGDILSALLAAGSVVCDLEGRVRPVQRYFIPPVGDDPEIVKRFGLRLRDLAATIDYNAAHSKDRIRNFEATAYSLRLSHKNLTLFRRLVADQGTRFLEQMDSWLGSHESGSGETESEFLSAGVGIYVFTEGVDDHEAQETEMQTTETPQGIDTNN
jgi:hypothetical protein